MRKLYIFSDYFYPSKKAGGPIISLLNIVEHFEEEFDIHVLCSAFDVHESKVYPNISINQENKQNQYSIYYASKSYLMFFKHLLQLTLDEESVIYINTFFSIRFHFFPLLMLRFKQWKSKNIIVSPRGQLMDAALYFKQLRKKLYVSITRMLFSSLKITYHSTSSLETQVLFNKGFTNIYPLSNLPSNSFNILPHSNSQLKLVFYSRIHPKKNLKFVLEVLSKIDLPITLDVYGNIEDKQYFEKSFAVLKQLSPNLRVTYRGLIEQKDVFTTLSQYDCFFVPSLGENYGHAFVEAMQSSCLILTSDQTPWTIFDSNTVFAYPLSSYKPFIKKIIELSFLSPIERLQLRMQIRRKIETHFDVDALLESYKDMFNA